MVQISVSPVSIIPPMLYANILILILSEGQAGKAWEHANKALLFPMSGNI
jgi:hypothetical protein